MTEPRLTVWPPLPPSVHLRRPRALPFPLSDPRCRIYARGRHALWQGIAAVGLARGDGVLAPAYHHGSEIETLLRAGADVSFYEVGDDLQPDESALAELVTEKTRALYLTHFIGFPQNGARWRAWCDERGLLLIEDVAQAWMGTSDGESLGSWGDVSIFCLYKTFGVPDGGAVLARGVKTPSAGPRGGGRLLRRHGAWLMSRSGGLARLGGTVMGGGGGGDDDLAVGDPASPPYGSTLRTLPRAYEADAAERRRGNYRYLLERLGDLVPPPFEVLPEGAAPFAFPVGVGEKDAVLRRLSSVNIDAQNFWAIPHPALQTDRFPLSSARRASIVGLPVHQELRPKDLARIAAETRAASER